MKPLPIFFILFLFSLPSLAQSIKATSFHYEMYLQVDYKKREAYLRKTGGQAGVYEKPLTSINKSFHAANVVDKVETSGNRYVINSKAELVGAIHYALLQQKLIRSSSGIFDKNGWVTQEYKEKRGNADQLITRFDQRTNKTIFRKGNQVRHTINYIPSVDVLSIAYQFQNRDLPAKEFKVAITDGKSIKQYYLKRSANETIKFQGIDLDTAKYYRIATKDDPTTMEIWYSIKDKWPVKYVIGLSDKYGATIQANLLKVHQ